MKDDPPKIKASFEVSGREALRTFSQFLYWLVGGGAALYVLLLFLRP